MATKPWYKELGFFTNPFSIKPLAFHEELYGYNLREIFSKINAGQVFFIEGEYGKGKTTILKRIIREFGGGRKLIYYSCNRSEKDINFNSLIGGRWGALGKVLGIKGTNLILLLDEAQDITESDANELKKLYKKHIKSIVLVGSSLNGSAKNGVDELVGENLIRLDELSEEDAVKIIRKRIGGISLLSDDIIKKIFEKSERNPRRLLKNCEDICRHVINKGYKKVEEQHLSVIYQN
ncbi:MAG: ATP-binding protein [Nanoarchaeota archaeon]